jgi:hypothetical protein
MALAKKAKRIRTADEFTGQLRAALKAPLIQGGVWSWDIEAIRAARDLQMLGQFARPAKLAAAFRTDDAMSVAHENRLAPQRGLPVKMVAANDKSKALKICEEAEALYGAKGMGLTKATLANVDSDLANHGVAFTCNQHVPREDGSRVDIIARYWPIEHVRWDANEQTYKTRVEGWGEETITHGDGRWTVYSQYAHAPWTYGCLLAGALVWARHAFGVRDWSKSASVQGNAKVVGTLPEGIALDSPEALQFLDLLAAVASLESPYGIQPFGSKIDYITNNAATWQLFQEIVRSGEVSAARIYLGQDGTIGTNPTAPGIDASHLFGVRNDIVEGALSAITAGVRTGILEVWCAVNWGDSTLCPDRQYQIPDADEDARRASSTTQRNAFYDAIERERVLGFDVTADRITALAAEYGVAPAALAPSLSKPAVALAPTDVAKVVTVNEARASAGLGPLMRAGLPDPDGNLTVSAFTAKQEAGGAPPAAAVPALRRV